MLSCNFNVINKSDTPVKIAKQQMETTVQNLRAMYNAQMKEKIERIHNRIESKLNTEVKAELTDTLLPNFQNKADDVKWMKAEEWIQEDMECRLIKSGSRICKEGWSMPTNEAEEWK